MKTLREKILYLCVCKFDLTETVLPMRFLTIFLKNDKRKKPANF